jgi:putative (di)nucleoside polyphosphate hydrolase
MIDIDGYRANVGIIIINDEKKVLWAKRLNEDAWQFPQGGINDNESAEEAMYRELKEEVGLNSNHILILARTKGWLRYDVPKNWIRNNSQQKYKGQKQVWFLLKFIGNDADIFLKNTSKPEFDGWEWVNFWTPIDEVVDFKKDVYTKALSELNEYV